MSDTLGPLMERNLLEIFGQRGDGNEQAGYGFRLRSSSYGGQVASNPP
jgi:hypothetical protein